jgi:catechol 2,3-dioxygenase-like lactoylglutathione lyase family enzyme
MRAMRVAGVLETCLYARDLTAARRFYSEVIGLAVHTESDGRHVFFRCGRAMLLVFNPESTASKTLHVGGAAVPLHGAVGPGHVAFAVGDDEIAPWRERLRTLGVAVESEIEWPGGGRSIYVRDPAGNSVEFATPRLWGIAEDEALR